MKNFVQPGEVVTVPAPYNVAAGAGAQVGAALFGIAQTDAQTGADVALVTEGVFDSIAKATGAAWVVGDIIYWDNAAKNATKTNTGNLRIGIALAAAASGDTSGTVKLGTFVVA